MVALKPTKVFGFGSRALLTGFFVRRYVFFSEGNYSFAISLFQSLDSYIYNMAYILVNYVKCFWLFELLNYFDETKF